MLTALALALAALGAVAPPGFRPLESRFGSAESGRPGEVEVRVRTASGKPLWMLLDSGSYATFVRGDGVTGGTLLYAGGHGAVAAVRVGKTPRGIRWDDTRSDGVLGADGMARLTWFVDYRNRKVWVRSEAGTPALAAALAATGRARAKSGATFALPLTRKPEDGTWQASLAQGDEAPIRWTLDTGSNQSTVPAALPGIGAPVSRLDFDESFARRSREGHLLRLRLPGAPVPLLAFTHEDDVDEPVLSPSSLTADWMLFDPLAHRAIFPRVGADEAARWVAEWLTRGALVLAPAEVRARIATPALVRELARVGSPEELARARAVAAQIAGNFERERERARAISEAGKTSELPPPPPSLAKDGHHWRYYNLPGGGGVWGQIPSAPGATSPPAPSGPADSGHFWLYIEGAGWVQETGDGVSGVQPSRHDRTLRSRG